MRLRFEVHVNVDRFTGDWECTGRVAVYASLTVGKRRWWVQRWDIERAPGGRLRSRDGLMGWTWGGDGLGLRFRALWPGRWT